MRRPLTSGDILHVQQVHRMVRLFDLQPIDRYPVHLRRQTREDIVDRLHADAVIAKAVSRFGVRKLRLSRHGVPSSGTIMRFMSGTIAGGGSLGRSPPTGQWPTPRSLRAHRSSRTLSGTVSSQSGARRSISAGQAGKPGRRMGRGMRGSDLDRFRRAISTRDALRVNSAQGSNRGHIPYDLRAIFFSRESYTCS